MVTRVTRAKGARCSALCVQTNGGSRHAVLRTAEERGAEHRAIAWRRAAPRGVVVLLCMIGIAGIAAAAPPPSTPDGAAVPAPSPLEGSRRDASAPSAPPGGEPRLLVKTPAGGSYLAWLEGHGGAAPVTSPPVSFTGAEASLPLPTVPEGLSGWVLIVLDQKTGYSASRALPARPTEAVALAANDFNRVHRLRVQVTGAGGRPVASGTATLTDAGGTAATRVWDPTANGTVEFTAVQVGTAKLEVKPSGGGSTTKEVEVRLGPGETAQTVVVSLPEVTAVVEAPAAAPAGTTGDTSAAPAVPAAPGQPMPAPSGGPGPLTTLVGFVLLAGAIYALYVVGKNRGWTLDKALARIGVQPGPEPATAGPVSLRPEPAPPPVDPSVCPFCGDRKDPATGRCSCSLDTLPSASGVGAATPGVAASSDGPRLIGVQGVYMGRIFPLSREVTIGRDPSNDLALPEDATVSRRHARISPADDGFQIVDLGSSNGTFVNGGRVTDAMLRPGDEVSIGNTRFRFEI